MVNLRDWTKRLCGILSNGIYTPDRIITIAKDKIMSIVNVQQRNDKKL